MLVNNASGGFEIDPVSPSTLTPNIRAFRFHQPPFHRRLFQMSWMTMIWMEVTSWKILTQVTVFIQPLLGQTMPYFAIITQA